MISFEERAHSRFELLVVAQQAIERLGRAIG